MAFFWKKVKRRGGESLPYTFFGLSRRKEAEKHLKMRRCQTKTKKALNNFYLWLKVFMDKGSMPSFDLIDWLGFY